jgi:citrate lyase subunit beta/citryl-CoA lyase
MIAHLRPRRSCLYMPGANPKALAKARELEADALIFDLEDSVAPEMKEAARAGVIAALAEGGYGARERIVRVNALATPWGERDIEAMAEAPIDAVLVPKIHSAEDVAAVDETMSEAGMNAALWIMIETPLSILNVKELAAAAKRTRLACFVMGTNDLAKELHTQPAPERAPILFALSAAVAGARAYGLAAIDGVFNDIQNAEGFAEECRQGRALGFDGKTLIHPTQLEPCNAIFAPSAEETADARAIIEAFALPENVGKGVIKVNGRMTELLHLEQARRTVAIADAIGRLS